MRSLRGIVLCALAMTAIPVPGEAQIVAAVLPGSRSVTVGMPAAVFATVVNAGPTDATGCSITLASPPAGVALSYQTTDPASNQATGSPDTPVTIPAKGSQSFVVTLTASAPVGATELAFEFGCDGSAPAATTHGVNTLWFSASAWPVLDIVALAVTTSGDGVARITGAGAFAVATANLGAAGTATATPYVGTTPLPLDLAVCQTDPATSDCLTPPAPSVDVAYRGGSVATYGVFVTATGDVTPDPAAHRVGLAFHSNVQPRGATSLAVEALCTTACAASGATPFGALTIVEGPASLGSTFAPQLELGPIPSADGYMAVAWYGRNRVDPSMVLTYFWASGALRGVGLNREGVGPVEHVLYALECDRSTADACGTIAVDQAAGTFTFADTRVPSLLGDAPLVLRGTLRLR